MFAVILPALLAAANPSAADSAALDAQLVEIFRPYTLDQDDLAAWERPLFSAEVTRLIKNWEKVQPDDQPDALNDGDWFCQCQDWDAAGFKTRFGPQHVLPDGSVEVDVTIDLGVSDPPDVRQAKFTFKLEKDGWKLDEIRAADAFQHGLKQALRDTIEEDEMLLAGKRK